MGSEVPFFFWVCLSGGIIVVSLAMAWYLFCEGLDALGPDKD